MNLDKHFASPFLKASDVKQGTLLQFTNAGSLKGEGDDARFQIGVTILTTSGKSLKEKLFTVNRTNYRTISSVYGSDTEEWIGKTMQCNITKVRNPKTGERVDSIELSLPNTTAEGDVELQ